MNAFSSNLSEVVIYNAGNYPCLLRDRDFANKSVPS